MRIALAVVCVACTSPKPTTLTAPPAAAPIAVPLTAASQMITTEPIVREDISPPFSLTASDGSGLHLVRVEAKAVVEGPLAFTELHLFFHNPELRQREGRFQITLPERAAISRFAMENRGSWMEAEVVPKMAARRAYEDFLHRRQDPALLEKAAGNQFTARVFPIFANEEKHLVVSYSQELPGTRYSLPLRGLPMAKRVNVELAVVGSDGKRTTQRLTETNWQPDRDFVSTAPAAAAAVASGTSIATQVEIGGASARDVPRGITLLVDTSASRALGFSSYLAKVKTLVAELRATWGDALPLQIVAFDQDAQLVFEGRAEEVRDIHMRTLVERGAAGASDIGQALEWIARRGVLPRVVMVTDAVITAGAEGAELATIAKKLGKVERLDTILIGGLRDDSVAKLLTRALPRAGAVLDLDRDQVATALGETVMTNVTVDVPGAAWVYPRTIASARAGTKTMVYARLANASRSIDVVVGGARQNLTAVAGTAPLVERAIAGAQIAELEATPKKTDAVRAQISKLSVASRVLSSETAMLVLESESDYPRYNIDRKALTDVLVVGTNGVERVPRADITPIPTRVGAAPVVIENDRVVHRGPPPPPTPGPAIDNSRTPDTDSDRIVDALDKCPSEPEAYNGLDDDDGCPDRGRVVMTSTQIVILDRVHFEPGRAVIRRESFPLLDAVAQALLGNPEIALVEIQGHTDERDSDGRNLGISRRRAENVKTYLVNKGVDPNRLQAQGYGETMPLDPRHNEAAWAKNRRVDFLILKRGDGDWSRTPTQFARGPSKPTPPPAPPSPITGELAEIKKALAARDVDTALAKARDWHAKEPGNVLALVGLGEALEARRADQTAARVYGSIIDLFPGRADMRRFAGERLSRLPDARNLTVDTFKRAAADRPDHLTGHRLLAYAQLRANKPADAFATILAALSHDYRRTSFIGARRILEEDAGMIAAAYGASVPTKRAEIATALRERQLQLATKPSTRFILYWETDSNDVDLHIEDARGHRAYYDSPTLPSGGTLYADVTNGYGPEAFVIEGKPTGGPYNLSVDYYSQGPMGYGMGTLQIQKFDPQKGITFEDRPFVIMTNRAKLDLGVYR